MEAWTDEVMNGSHRDQLSFNYVCWKNNDVKVNYLDKKICKSLWFDWRAIHTKKHSKAKNIPITELNTKIRNSKELFNSLVSPKRIASNTMYNSFNQY